MRAATSKVDVFINCPFDGDYDKIFKALIFTLYACGFRPRTAKEIDDGGEVRLEKLYGLINECRYGIHDISRTALDKRNRLPRFNMPLELGIFLGAKRYGGPSQKNKRLLIFDVEPYRYQKFISDLAGMDIHAHGNDAKKVVIETRDWLANVSRRELISGVDLLNLYGRFFSRLPDIAKSGNLDFRKLVYVDFERLVANWLLDPG